jgi:chromosome segregation ATPase
VVLETDSKVCVEFNSKYKQQGPMKSKLLTFRKLMPLAALTCVLAPAIESNLAASYTAELTNTRGTFEEWVRVQMLISEESEGWKQEKSALQDMIEVAQAERETLDERIEDLRETIASGDQRRTELNDQIDAARERAALFRGKLVEQEKALTQKVQFLPPPLKRDLRQLTRSLPEDPENTQMALSQRMQTVVGIITQMERFQDTLSLESEIREIESGQTAEVKTLYLGLSQAIFADASGRYAGIGVPAQNEWQWQVITETATVNNIRNAIAMHENEMEPAFVSLPFELKSLF